MLVEVLVEPNFYAIQAKPSLIIVVAQLNVFVSSEKRSSFYDAWLRFELQETAALVTSLIELSNRQSVFLSLKVTESK